MSGADDPPTMEVDYDAEGKEQRGFPSSAMNSIGHLQSPRLQPEQLRVTSSMKAMSATTYTTTSTTAITKKRRGRRRAPVPAAVGRTSSKIRYHRSSTSRVQWIVPRCSQATRSPGHVYEKPRPLQYRTMPQRRAE